MKTLHTDLALEDIQNSVRQALAEDIGPGDLTAALVPVDQIMQACVITREKAVIAGQPYFDEVFAQLDPSIQIQWHVRDGDQVEPDTELCHLKGKSRALLTGERSALNFLQCLSGTATQTALYVAALSGTSTRLLDTRKTLPGLRAAQKYAVRCAGGTNHRMGLYDAFLIKENHIAACGSIKHAIEQARAIAPNKIVEIEVENLDELKQALTEGADIIMLDNFDLPQIKAAVAYNQHRAKLEVSGNVTLDTLRTLAETGVDFISCGALTKHVRAIDLSMRVLPQ